MSAGVGVTPQPESVATWSPSSYNTLSRCALSLAFDRDSSLRSRYRRGSTFTATGKVAHALTERIGTHEFDAVPIDDLKVALSAAWEEGAAKEFEDLCTSWAPSSPPSPRDWPFYATTKARTLVRLRGDMVRYREWAAHGDGGNAALVENEMRDDSINLAGRADRIERKDDRIVVVDLKAGAEVDSISEDNRRQLMLYAHLYRTEHGVIPDSIVVMNASGSRFEEAIDPASVDQVIKEFTNATTAFNKAVHTGKDLSLLATPSQQSCRWCTYRVVCAQYWDAVEPEWNDSDAAGVVLSRQGESAISIELVAPEHRRGKVCQVVAATALECSAGDVVTITDAYFEGDVLRCRWNSRFGVF